MARPARRPKEEAEEHSFSYEVLGSQPSASLGDDAVLCRPEVVGPALELAVGLAGGRTL
jgi:hypothetical protein